MGATREWREKIEEASEGRHGCEQQRIAWIGMAWLCLLLGKNSDYGSSAWKEPVLCPELDAGAAILVRMSDKIERLRTLLGQSGGGGAQIATETIDDTIRDLGGYCLLYLARPQREQPDQNMENHQVADAVPPSPASA